MSLKRCTTVGVCLSRCVRKNAAKQASTSTAKTTARQRRRAPRAAGAGRGAGGPAPAAAALNRSPPSGEALDGVRAQAEAQRLEREHVGGGDVAEVALGAEVLEQPDLLLRGSGASKIRPLGVDRVRDLVDQPRAQLAVGAVDARRARLARLGDHLPRAGVEIAFDLLDPDVRRP